MVRENAGEVITRGPGTALTVQLAGSQVDGQPVFTPSYPTQRACFVTVVMSSCLLRGSFICYKQRQRRTAPEMSSLRHFEGRRHRTWCALVVLAAVCSLTVNVATRYSSPLNPSSPTVKTVRTHTAPDAKRQRLAKNAADWAPPVVCFDVLRSPRSYPRISPAGPPIPNLLLEESLYNRPPPFSESFS